MLGRHSPILVVDDNAASRKITHQCLHALGYPLVDYAPDARTALRMIQQKNYTIILPDGDSKVVDSLGLLGHARADSRYRHLAFLMVIAFWQKKFIEIVREDGATLYMTKPFKIETLGERMAQVDLDASRLRATQTVSRPGPSELWKQLRAGL